MVKLPIFVLIFKVTRENGLFSSVSRNQLTVAARWSFYNVESSQKLALYNLDYVQKTMHYNLNEISIV